MSPVAQSATSTWPSRTIKIRSTLTSLFWFTDMGMVAVDHSKGTWSACRECQISKVFLPLLKWGVPTPFTRSLRRRARMLWPGVVNWYLSICCFAIIPVHWLNPISSISTLNFTVVRTLATRQSKRAIERASCYCV